MSSLRPLRLEDPLEALCAAVPEAIGAVLCDYEGETVVNALGSAAPPAEAEARASDHVPKNLPLTMPVAEFLVRLAGAEPCALLRQFVVGNRAGAGGQLRSFSTVYEQVEMLVHCLPEDFYVVLVVRRPAIEGRARFHLAQAAEILAPHVM